MSLSTSNFSPGDAVIISDTALIYSGLSVDHPSDTRIGLVLSIQNAREKMDLDNDANLVETLLSSGEVEWIWEQDLVNLNS